MTSGRIACGLVALIAVSACGSTSLSVSGAPVAMNETRALSSDQKIGRGSSLVRSFTEGANGDLVEVAGATCRIRSSQLSVQIVTPREVTYPGLLQAARFSNRGAPENLVVTCSKGDRSGQQVVLPVTERGPSVQTIKTAPNPNTPQASGTLIPLTRNVSSSYPWVFPREIRVTLK